MVLALLGKNCWHLIFCSWFLFNAHLHSGISLNPPPHTPPHPQRTKKKIQNIPTCAKQCWTKQLHPKFYNWNSSFGVCHFKLQVTMRDFNLWLFNLHCMIIIEKCSNCSTQNQTRSKPWHVEYDSPSLSLCCRVWDWLLSNQRRTPCDPTPWLGSLQPTLLLLRDHTNESSKFIKIYLKLINLQAH